MKLFAMVAPIHSSILLFTLLYVVYINALTYKSAIFSMFIAYLITSSFMLIYISKYLLPKFDTSWANTLTKFAIYSINQIFINMYMSTEALGIYNAYSFASINTAAIFFNIFNSVFFPTASKCNDMTIILKRINKITPYLIGFGIPIMVFIQFVILSIYGSSYTIDILLMISFAIFSILIVYYGIYNWTFCSRGIDGVKLVNKSSILIAIINIILAMYFIPRLGIIGAPISTAIALIIGIYFLLSKGKNFKL